MNNEDLHQYSKIGFQANEIRNRILKQFYSAIVNGGSGTGQNLMKI